MNSAEQLDAAARVDQLDALRTAPDAVRSRLDRSWNGRGTGIKRHIGAERFGWTAAAGGPSSLLKKRPDHLKRSGAIARRSLAAFKLVRPTTFA